MSNFLQRLRRGAADFAYDLASHHTRFMLKTYLRLIFVVTMALTMIALAIDLWPQMPGLSDAGIGFSSLGGAAGLLYFCLLRIADLVPPFFPFACFLGVLWAEVDLTLSRARLLFLNSGRAPRDCLVPLLVAGVLLGGTEFTLDAFVRPAAMQFQIAEHLGTLGQSFDRAKTVADVWLDTHHELVHAGMSFSPEPELHHAEIYELDSDGRLASFDWALTAVPQGNGVWLLQHGWHWSGSAPAAAMAEVADDREAMVPFATRGAVLALDPLWLRNWGIYPQYLSFGTLRALGARDPDQHQRGLFTTWVQVKYAEAVMPGAMALLASVLAMSLFAYRAPLLAQFFVLLAGYFAYFAAKLLALMGTHGYIGAVPAAWVAPGLLIGVAFALLRIDPRRWRAIRRMGTI